jgi:hypothetical protein
VFEDVDSAGFEALAMTGNCRSSRATSGRKAASIGFQSASVSGGCSRQVRVTSGGAGGSAGAVGPAVHGFGGRLGGASAGGCHAQRCRRRWGTTCPTRTAAAMIGMK